MNDISNTLNAIARIDVSKARFNYNRLEPVPFGTAVGSGFLIEQQGVYYIVTNFHVVSEAILDERTGLYEIYATFLQFTGDELKTRLMPVKLARHFDIAILKFVEYEKTLEQFNGQLKTLELDTENTATFEQFVTAFGYPLGTERPVPSFGQITGISVQQGVAAYRTSTTVDPGNSGGPLVDSKTKKVVGVIYAGSGRSGNFAIANTYLRILLQNIGRGTLMYKPVNLGIKTSEANATLITRLTSSTKYVSGRQIVRVLGGSFASNIGIEAGDILVKFDGKNVNTKGKIFANIEGFDINVDIGTYFYQQALGTSVTLTVLRNGIEKELEARIGDGRYFDYTYRQFPFDDNSTDYVNINGIIVTDFNTSSFNTFPRGLSNTTPIPYVFVNAILNARAVDRELVVSAGDIIKSIENIDVFTLTGVRKRLGMEKTEKEYQKEEVLIELYNGVKDVV